MLFSIVNTLMDWGGILLKAFCLRCRYCGKRTWKIRGDKEYRGMYLRRSVNCSECGAAWEEDCSKGGRDLEEIICEDRTWILSERPGIF